MDKEALLARVKAISMRTQANGFTEAEAMAAAEKLNQLLTAHGLSMTDIEIQESTCEDNSVELGMHEVRVCAASIANLMDCNAWAKPYPRYTVIFFGLPGDVEAAGSLLRMLKATINSEAVQFLAEARGRGFEGGRRAGHAFKLGMAERISARLSHMKHAAAQEAKQTSGRDVVLVKRAVVDQQWAALNLNLAPANSPGPIEDGHAYYAGKLAGDRVSLNRKIGKDD